MAGAGYSWAASAERKALNPTEQFASKFVFLLLYSRLFGGLGWFMVCSRISAGAQQLSAASSMWSPAACGGEQSTGLWKGKKTQETWALYLDLSVSHQGCVQPCSCIPVGGKVKASRSLRCQRSDTSCWASLCSLAWRHQAGHPLWLEISLWGWLSRLSAGFSPHVSPRASHPNQVDQIFIPQSYPFIPHKSSHLTVV